MAKPKTKEKIVAEALAEIRKIVADVKSNSFSDFEYLKREVQNMLVQPDKI